MKAPLHALVLGIALVASSASADGEVTAQAQDPTAQALPAVLDGDPILVATIGDELGHRGIATSAPPDGEAVRVRLAREPQGIVVDLHDPQGRAAARTVASPDTAAALIESWSRREIADPLLAPRRPPEAAAPVPPPTIVATPAPPAEPPPSRWRPSARIEATTADAGGWWLAARAGLCLQVGPACLGGEARLARRFGREVSVADPPLSTSLTYDRSDWQALVTADLPITLGRPTLLLGLGAGLGRWLDDGHGTVGPRSELRADLLLPLWSRLAVDVGLSAALERHEDAREWAAVRTDGQLRLGLGLRWGQP